ncbi:MAG TPA: lysophospholipid acyltransferase family protein [Urbifossiella sp.]|nr:lysophospholipid acyltransferase family protein [Urbifossiella sp.]
MKAKGRRWWVDAAAYLAVRAIVAAAQTVYPWMAYRFADAFAAAAVRLLRRRVETASDNIRQAFPHLADQPAHIDRLVHDMFRHFAHVALEFILMPRKLNRSTLRRHLAFPDEPLVASLFNSGRPVLVVTAHFGNWEVAGAAFGLLGYRTHAIARVLDNPYLERYLLRLRQATGQTIIAKQDDFARLDAILSEGGNVATLVDQDAGPRGLFVDFFGRKAAAHKAVALLALKYDAIILVGSVPRLPRPKNADGDGLEAMRYAYALEEVIDPRGYASRGRAAAVRAITERYTAAFERFIRRHPEQYFWLHRRWKTQPPLAPETRRAA